MSIIDRNFKKIETPVRLIGKMETTTEKVAEILVGMMESMGMANPSALTRDASKAIIINKKDDTYTLILSVYTPPIEISWSENIPFEKLLEMIDQVVEDRKKIGFINILTSGKTKSFQLALN